MSKIFFSALRQFRFEIAVISGLFIAASLIPLAIVGAFSINNTQLHTDSVIEASSLPPIVEKIRKFASTSEAGSITNPAIRNNSVMWPLGGRVTTEFGVPHRPWQHTHSGIDITSARLSGVAPIETFKHGTVSKTVHSYRGLGNYVVVDHEPGLQSLYAHLSRIIVAEGQSIDTGTTIGYEGSTGNSTGPHLHFEIRQNGTPVNPRLFINGNP